jgi:hypothetical protein
MHMSKTSNSISYECVTVTNAFAVDFLCSLVVLGGPETHSYYKLLIQKTLKTGSLHSVASPWPNVKAKDYSQTFAGDLRVTVTLVST